MATMGAPVHACCPRSASSGTNTVSDSCCTLHHQPATINSVVEIQQSTVALVPLTALIPATSSLAGPQERLNSIPSQRPPLIALRI